MPAEERDAATPESLSLFASLLSHHRFRDEDLRVLEAALSAGGDVPALLSTRSAARRLLRARAAEVFPAEGSLEEGMRLSIADFFARAFALVGDVESCLAMRYEALVLRDAKYPHDHHLQVSREEWFTFAQDSLDNGFYTIASKILNRNWLTYSNGEVSSLGTYSESSNDVDAFANALAYVHPRHPRHLDSSNSIEDSIKDITGLQNLAKSLSAQHSVQTQSTEYMKRRASGVCEKYNLQSGKPKLPGSLMFRLGIKTRNIQKLLHSREGNLEQI